MLLLVLMLLMLESDASAWCWLTSSPAIAASLDSLHEFIPPPNYVAAS